MRRLAALGPFAVLVRAGALVALLWVGGFVWFVATLPGPAPAGARTDAAIVLTGGPRRVPRGIAVMEARLAGRLLISGVARDVRPHELAAANGASPRLFDCCVDLGFVADDTRTNATESGAWVAKRGYRSIRLITASYHLPRAVAELRRAMPPGVRIVEDGVAAGLPPWPLAREYTKYAVVRAMQAMGLR